MHRRYDTRHIFMAIGACIAFLSPVFLIIIPLVVVNTLYDKRDIWITYVPGANYAAFGVGVFFLILACALLWLFDVRKWTVSAGILCLILCGFTFYVASLSYVTLSDEEISYRKLFSKEKQIYDWRELDELLYYEKFEEDKELSHYEFHFKDGQVLTIKQNSFVAGIQGSISSKVRGLGIPLEYVED
ncbi:hypothetical protein PB01_02015 [Psychrobacillus glaciei]|uniref:Uncharacterized protein n=1 Tax=Psychrobacillus glaciei TaxID=2283160 RepID=A0A5J6SIA5_9BACI|nr:hypothetical protein [Psychrobacillus glaciei]QFF97676.1 hypothetical protein PB01_02015 [Psychrobacillus glaciei]